MIDYFKHVMMIIPPAGEEASIGSEHEKASPTIPGRRRPYLQPQPWPCGLET